MARTGRARKEKLLKLEESTLSNIINKDKFIEVTKKHIDAVGIVSGETSDVYTFLASLYIASVITLDDLQHIGFHMKMCKDILDSTDDREE